MNDSIISPSDKTVGGLAAPFLLTDFGTTAQFVTDTTLLGTSAQNQAVIFGVSVAQVPTCSQTDTLPDGTNRLSNINPGKFQLVIQTGAAKLGTGGQATASGVTSGAGSGAATFDVPPVVIPAHIEAWASIVE